MPSPKGIMSQVNAIINYLVKFGLADDQNLAFQKDCNNKYVEITFPKADLVSFGLKDRPYFEIYDYFRTERAYNVLMPDGAILQMMYEFKSKTLNRHRLAFFPSPYLEEFQKNPEIYLEDEIYAEVVARNIIPFPLRFDYDAREGIYKDIEHSKSHLTLGQYEDCRIPVTAPVTPFWFVDFILRNFYHTEFLKYANRLPKYHESFDESITLAEKNIVYIKIPRIT